MLPTHAYSHDEYHSWLENTDHRNLYLLEHWAADEHWLYRSGYNFGSTFMYVLVEIKSTENEIAYWLRYTYTWSSNEMNNHNHIPM